MKRVLVAGAGGRMGERVLHWLDAHEALQCGGALEAPGHPRIGEDVAPGVTLTHEAKAALEGVDAVIDFTVPGATLDLMGAAADALPALCAAPEPARSDSFKTLLKDDIRSQSALAKHFHFNLYVSGELNPVSYTHLTLPTKA